METRIFADPAKDFDRIFAAKNTIENGFIFLKQAENARRSIVRIDAFCSIFNHQVKVFSLRIKIEINAVYADIIRILSQESLGLDQPFYKNQIIIGAKSAVGCLKLL